jgi:hypothetical protein
MDPISSPYYIKFSDINNRSLDFYQMELVSGVLEIYSSNYFNFSTKQDAEGYDEFRF